MAVREISVPVTLRPSRLNLIVLMFASACFAAVGLWGAKDEPLAGYLIVGVGVMGVLLLIIYLLPNSSYLRLTPEGFTYCNLYRSHTVRWSDVAEFTVIQIKFNRMVGWDYAPHFQGQAISRAIAKRIGGAQAALPDSYGMKPEELANLMDDLRQMYS